MKKILILFYSQTGQLKLVLDRLAEAIRCLSSEELIIDHAVITPHQDYNFPWSLFGFLNVFPESVLGVCQRVEIDWTPEENTVPYNLVLLGYSPWFLSLSVPLHSAMRVPRLMRGLKGVPVVSVAVCRNTWVMAYLQLLDRLSSMGAVPVGNVVLSDPAPGVISLYTMLRWQLTGRKISRCRTLPESGASAKQIQSVEHYAEPIWRFMKKGQRESLRQSLRLY